MEPKGVLLEGRWVRLRPLRKEDLPRRLEMINDPEVQRLTVGVVADPTAPEDAEAWFFMLSQDPYSEQFAVETRDGVYIGDIDLHSIHVNPGEAWVSPMVGDRRFFAGPHRAEALSLVLDYAFGQKQLERVRIQIPETDVHGLRILEELGFRQVDEWLLDMMEGVRELTLEVDAQSFRPYRPVASPEADTGSRA